MIYGIILLSLPKNFIDMTLRELEIRLISLQKEMEISYSWIEKHRDGLKFDTVKKIQSGGNYRVGSLFQYLELLTHILVINNNQIEDQLQLGEFFKSKRIEAGLSVFDMSLKMKCPTKVIYNFEEGKGSVRNTFNAYAESLDNISFDIISMIDVL